PLGTQNGLFSILGLSPEQVLKIREDHGVYMAGTSRINVAGLTKGNIQKFIDALADVAG
ncbi:MAG: aminotransferase class I/II-fold pyridoxal phosphate-dependent enzyme, partial [Novosphingobium sp.]|nr:aminotransferase class I/II-fold pyridoxal phosphate-dependent enzyme [Novosphingobium sp.]